MNSFVRATFITFLFFYTKIAIAFGNVCDVGAITGYVTYNVPYHIVSYTPMDFVHGNALLYRTEIDGPGSYDLDHWDWGGMLAGGGNAGAYMEEPADGSYAISGSADIGYPAAAPVYVLANISDSCIAVTRTVNNPASVNLSIPSTLTLNDDYNFAISVVHPFAFPTNYRIEIKRTSFSTYDTLYSGSFPGYSSYSKVAGNFHVRATATVNGQTYTSPVRNHTVNFMNFSQISTNPQNIAGANDSWNYMISLLTLSTRQEVGTWVRFNTATRSYEYIPSPVQQGPLTSNIGVPPPASEIHLPTKPADSPPTVPSPLDSPTYTVASFHVHTPGTNLSPAGQCIPPGPSGFDNTEDTAAQITGLVYTYDSLHCSGASLTAPHSIKKSGLDRRPTP